MKNYANYDAADFTEDDEFLQWIKYPNESNTTFWQNWLRDHPHKKEDVEEARRMVLAFIHEDQHFPSAKEKKLLWERVENTLERESAEKRNSYTRWYLSAAAVALLAIIISISLFHFANEKPALITSSQPETLIDQINHGDSPITVTLEDGSSIVLRPGSAIHYPSQFDGDHREVFLEGEAFFEITRDTQRPFLVYANEVVTKVLGTSFIVRAFDGEPSVTVEVKTGKVSVFRKQDVVKTQDENSPSVEGLVLIPNQQAVYSRDGSRLTKSLVENPVVLPSSEVKTNFEFTDEPMKNVFSAIEEAYGIEIIYDDDVMANCYLNASLSHESLKEKLSLICRAVNASYEVVDTHIIVYGKGCDE